MVLDLLYHGFMLATMTEIQTLFTMDVLDDHRQTNLDCKSSTYAYHLKLRRKTNLTNPMQVPTVYTLLRRLGRQHRLLKKLLWSGCVICGVKPVLGDLSVFCTACPQPGINLPGSYLNDPVQYMFVFNNVPIMLTWNIILVGSMFVYLQQTGILLPTTC